MRFEMAYLIVKSTVDLKCNINKESAPNLEMQIASSLERAKSLLDSTLGGFVSTTNTDVKISENFFPLLMLEATGNWYDMASKLGEIILLTKIY